MGRFDAARWRAIYTTCSPPMSSSTTGAARRACHCRRRTPAASPWFDVDTLWRRRVDGGDLHWKGRASKVYAPVDHEWKLTMHTGLPAYPPGAS